MYIYIQSLQLRPHGLFQFRYKFLKKEILYWHLTRMFAEGQIRRKTCTYTGTQTYKEFNKTINFYLLLFLSSLIKRNYRYEFLYGGQIM